MYVGHEVTGRERIVKEVLPGRIGLALGSGAARGWAHIGVIRALEAADIHPEIVCGSSVGAIVGAAYAADRLDEFEAWVRDLDRASVMRHLDLSFRGGLFKGSQFFDFMAPSIPDDDIANLRRPFAAVATDLETGREVWLRDGSLHAALRASVALPGLITPARREGRWLVDGGLVNPVPIALCRVLGAQTVIAVDLNTTLLNRRLTRVSSTAASLARERRLEQEIDDDEPEDAIVDSDSSDPDSGWTAAASRLRTSFESWVGDLRDRLATNRTDDTLPSLYEVLANSLNIMQVQITRSRMAGDPAEVLITPRLDTFALLDLDRGAEAITEGRRAANQVLASIPGSDPSASTPESRGSA
jgi:NTE family protein